MKSNAEIKTVYKWFWVWDFKKEESWLNSMAMQGWALKKVGFCKYTFEKCERSEYIVRCEFRKALQKGNEDYVGFVEELGAEYIGRVANMIYFRRKAELGSFELFSDNESKLKHLNSMAACIAAIMAANLVIGIVNSTMNYHAAHFAWINLAVSCVVAYGLGKTNAAREQLEAEKTIRE